MNTEQLRTLAIEIVRLMTLEQTKPKLVPEQTKPKLLKPKLVLKHKPVGKFGTDCGKLWGTQSLYQVPPGSVVGGGMQRDNVKATYHIYSPGYATSSLACADKFWADPDHGRKLSKYPWTAFCMGFGKGSSKFTQDVCGRCLRVTNRRTGASVIVRIVDNGGCSDVDGTGLDLDVCAFRFIDTDGKGHADGNMRVDVTEVKC